MSEPKPSDILEASPTGRQRESFLLHHGVEPTPEQIDVGTQPAQTEDLVTLEQGRQLVMETERSLDNLVSAIVGNQIDIDDPAMRDAALNKIRDLQLLLERSAMNSKRMERGERVVAERAEPDALSKFVQFSEEFISRVSATAAELREKELLYRDGDMGEEAYKAASDERRVAREQFEDEIIQHARPVHIDTYRAIASDASIPEDDEEKMDAKRLVSAYDTAYEYVMENLGVMDALSPQERIDFYWGRKEHQFLMPYKRAYDEIFSRYELQQAAHQLGKAELNDVEDARQDLLAAWEEKQTAFERMKKRLDEKVGFTEEEKLELIERSRTLLQPDVKPLLHFDDEKTQPIIYPEIVAEENLPTLELTEDDENEKQITELKKQVLQWRDVAKTLESADKLTPDVCAELLGELSKYDKQLQSIDTQGDHAGAAKERIALEALIKELRAKLEFSRDFYVNPPKDETPAPEKPTAKAVSVTDARSAYHEVVAAYTAVQHTLSVDQRRDIRTRIARMAGLVKRAELSHAVSHATEHAPAIAHATLASMPVTPRRYEVKTIPSVVPPQTAQAASSSRGIFGALGAAFRLK